MLLSRAEIGNDILNVWFPFPLETHTNPFVYRKFVTFWQNFALKKTPDEHRTYFWDTITGYSQTVFFIHFIRFNLSP